MKAGIRRRERSRRESGIAMISNFSACKQKQREREREQSKVGRERRECL